jgi:hypothetical protein
MKIALIVLAVLVGFVIFVVIVGALLPKQHVAVRRARFTAATSQVWQVISRFADQRSWRPELLGVERVADHNGHEVWRETMKNSPPLDFETVEIVPEKKLVRRIVNEKLPFGGEWVMALAPSAPGTTLTITENGEIHNPIFRFVARFFMGYTTTIDAYLRSLGRKLGEDVQIEQGPSTS